MKKLIAIALVLIMAFSVFGCTTSTEDFEIAVNFASEPNTIDPALNSAVDGAVMINHIFEGLYKWVDDGSGNATLALGQAKEVTPNADKTVYTVKLRDDIKWSDGKDVVAADFVYAWQRLVDPNTAADYCYMADIILNANEIMAGEMDKSELGVKAIDEKTLEITLHTACPYFEEIMAFPALMPIRSDIIEQYGDQWTFSPETYIGNGQYKMAEWSHNEFIKLVPSETYYDVDKLGPKVIKFALMDDTNAIYAAYRSGSLNFIQEVPVDEIPGLLSSGELKVHPYLGTYYCCFSTSTAPFDDVRVREAFSLVIDRNYIVENVTKTGQKPATAFVPSGISDAPGTKDDFRAVGGDYMDVSAEKYQENCERARQLLAEAGYPNGEGFPIVEYLYNTSDNHRLIGEALQNMWQTELGVTVNLVNQEWNTFLDTRKNGDYSIARNGWIADYNDPMTFLDMWVTGGGNNDAQYSNTKYDELIAAAKLATDPAERMSLMHQAEDLLMGEDSVLGPIYFYTQKYMISDRIDGMFYTPLGYFFFQYTQPAA